MMKLKCTERKLNQSQIEIDCEQNDIKYKGNADDVNMNMIMKMM